MGKETDSKNKNNQAKILQEALDAFGSAEEVQRALREYTKKYSRKKTNTFANSRSVLLRAQGVHKTYRRGRTQVDVLNGIDLEIYDGEFVAITGASGSGKSTLLQLLGGLDRPSKGGVLYGDVSLADLSDKELSRFRRQAVGFVFQSFYLQPFLKVSRNLEVAAMFGRKSRRKRSDVINNLSRQVGLEDRLDYLPEELSGGQMQRAAIARALMNQPKIILADEPTGNLDAKNSIAIIDLFEKIRDEIGTTIVIVTHDPIIAKRADREVKLKDGRLIW